MDMALATIEMHKTGGDQVSARSLLRPCPALGERTSGTEPALRAAAPGKHRRVRVVRQVLPCPAARASPLRVHTPPAPYRLAGLPGRGTARAGFRSRSLPQPGGEPAPARKAARATSRPKGEPPRALR